MWQAMRMHGAEVILPAATQIAPTACADRSSSISNATRYG
jgi:hypothetical protein